MNVSVVLPTYNSAMFVLQTIESILNQSVQPYEVIALDDGSDDETVSLLERYSPRLKVHRQQNRGVASARHTLCSMATGDLIAFIDHDDLWHPDYLKTQCQTAAQYPDALGFFTGHINFNGYRDFNWPDVQDEEVIGDELISLLDFVRRSRRKLGRLADRLRGRRKVPVDRVEDPRLLIGDASALQLLTSEGSPQ